MEKCFHKIDDCQDNNKHKETCIAESQYCFQKSNYGFDYCFKQLAHCVSNVEEGLEHVHSDDEEEHEHEECGCSCLISQCFDYGNKDACSYMFDVCFESYTEEDAYTHVHDDVDDVHCLDYVRECINEKDDHNECIDLMSQCFHPYSCTESVQQCINDNKYDIVQCYDVINECSTSQEEASSVKNCYEHIEECYTSSSPEDHDICTALLPTCYLTTELQTEDCYSNARSCLLNNQVENYECHQQLKVCLHKEESHGEGHYDDCTPVVEECLSNSKYSPSSCYHYLKQYVSGGQCQHLNPQPQHPNPQYTYQNYPEDSYHDQNSNLQPQHPNSQYSIQNFPKYPYQYHNNPLQYQHENHPQQGGYEANNQFNHQQQNLHNHQHRQDQEPATGDFHDDNYWSCTLCQ